MSKSQKTKAIWEKGFLYRNIVIYTDLMDLNQFSYLESLIVIGFSFSQIICTNLHGYQIIAKIPSGTFLDVLITGSTYVDLYNLMTIGESIHNFMLWMCYAFIFIYSLVYFGLLVIKKNKVKETFLGKTFLYFSKFYDWILFLPSCMIFLTNIFCSEQIMETFQSKKCVFFDKNNLIIILLSLSCIILSFSMVLINGYFSSSSPFMKSDYLSIHYERFLRFLNVFRFFCSILFTIPKGLQYYNYIYVISHIILGLWGVSLILIRFPFCKLFINRLILIFFVAYLAQSFGMFIDLITHDSLFLNTTNVILFMMIFFFFLQIFCLKIQNFLFYETLLTPINSKKSIDFIIKKTQILQNISNSFDKTHDFYFKGLFESHLSNCKNAYCFCKNSKLFDSKKDRELDIQKRYAFKQYQILISKYITKEWIEETLSLGKKTAQIQIFYSQFLFFKFRNIHQALWCLNSAEKIAFKPFDLKQIYQLKKMIKKFIKKKNFEYCDNKLEIEIIVFLEEQLEIIIEMMRNFFKKTLKLWKSLENFYPNLTEIDSVFSDLISIKNEIGKTCNPLKGYLNSKKKLKFYYQWYMKNILNKKLKFAEEEITDFNPNEENDELISVNSRQLLRDRDNDDKIIFQNDCSVVHVRSSLTGLGKIVKFNKNLLNIYDYTNDEIMNSEINRLMPSFFSKNHSSYVENYTKFGKRQVLYNSKLVFGLKKNGTILPIWLLVKQYVSHTGLIDYIGMMKPICSNKSKENYIILNDLGVIDGISENISHNLLISPETVNKFAVNILLMAPKLIRFFGYQIYLEKKETDIKKTKKKKKKTESRKSIPSSLILDAKDIFKSKKKKTLISSKLQTVLKSTKNSNDTKKGFISNLKVSQKEETYFLKKQTKGDELSKKVKLDENEDLKISQDMNNGLLNNISVVRSGGKKLSSIQKSDQTKQKLELSDIVGNNENKLEPPEDDKKSMHSSIITSEENNSNSDDDEDDTSNSDIESDLEDKDQQGTRISFNLKLPKNIEKFVRLYESFLIRKKDRDKKYKHASTLQICDNFDKNEKVVSIIINNNEKEKTEISSVFTEINKLKFKNNPIESKDAEQRKKELKAIYLTADRVSKEKCVNIYRVRATINTSYYGENKDALKILKIYSIQLKSEKFKDIKQEENGLSAANEAAKLRVRKSVLEATANFERKLTLSPTLANNFFNSRTISITNEISSSANLDENQAQMLNSLRKSGSFSEEKIDNNDNVADNTNTETKKFIQKNYSKTKYENIFWKEDTLKALKNLIWVVRIKWFIRILFLIVFGVNLFTFFQGPYQGFSDLKNKSDKIYLTKSLHLNMLEGYNNILNFLLINSNYYEDVLDSTTLSNYIDLIKKDLIYIYDFTIEFNKNPLFKEAVFHEKELISLSNNMNENLKSLLIRNLDLIFMLFEKIRNIYNLITNISEFNVTNQNINFFRTFIIPDISNLLNQIQINLFSEEYQTVNDIENFVFYMLFAQLGLFLFTFLILLHYILRVTNTYQAIIEVFTYIDNTDVKKTRKSLSELSKIIDENSVDNNLSILSNSQKNKEQTFDKNDQQYKKMKKFKVGTFLWVIKKKVLAYYFLFIVIISCLNIGFFFLVKNSTDKLQILLSNGNKILTVIEGNSISSIALKEKVFDSENYKNIIFPKILSNLNQYMELSIDIMLPDINFGNFDEISNNYFFGNPCQTFYNLTLPERNQCSNIALGKLNTGIFSFQNFFIDIIKDIIIENSEKKFSELTKLQLYEFDRAIDFTNQFILDIVSVWSQDITSVLDKAFTNLITYLIFMLIINVAAFAVAEYMVADKLNSIYQHYRQIYSHFMPAAIVSKERIIRAKLVISNVLKRTK